MHALLLFFLFSTASAVFTIQETNETFPNEDFFLMETNYSFSGSLFPAAFLGEDCSLDLSLKNQTHGKILFIDWTIASSRGCLFINEIIDDLVFLAPPLIVFSSKWKKDFGSTGHEAYGYYERYQHIGLQMTFISKIASDRIRELIASNSTITVFASKDEGSWVKFSKGAGLKVYVAVCCLLLGILWARIVYEIIRKLRREKRLSLLFIVYVSTSFFALFKILELAIDPLKITGRAPMWLRYFWFYTAYLFGYSSLALVSISWIRIGTQINFGSNQKKIGRYLSYYCYLSISLWPFVVISVCLAKGFAGSQFFQDLWFYIYLIVIIVVVSNSVLLFLSGVRILYILRFNSFVTNEASQRVFKKITLLMLSGVSGFLAIALCMGFYIFADYNINGRMAIDWARELAGIFLVSIIFSLSLNSADQQNKSASISMGSTNA